MSAQLYNSNLFGYQTYLEIKGSVVLIHLSVNWLAKAQRIIATKKIYVIANKQTIYIIIIIYGRFLESTTSI